MRRRPFSRVRVGALALVATAIALVTEAAARPGQTAEADQWQFHVGTSGSYCEGCCASPSNLCCDINAPCRHTYPAEPLGGG